MTNLLPENQVKQEKQGILSSITTYFSEKANLIIDFGDSLRESLNNIGRFMGNNLEFALNKPKDTLNNSVSLVIQFVRENTIVTLSGVGLFFILHNIAEFNELVYSINDKLQLFKMQEPYQRLSEILIAHQQSTGEAIDPHNVAQMKVLAKEIYNPKNRPDLPSEYVVGILNSIIYFRAYIINIIGILQRERNISMLTFSFFAIPSALQLTNTGGPLNPQSLLYTLSSLLGFTSVLMQFYFSKINPTPLK